MTLRRRDSFGRRWWCLGLGRRRSDLYIVYDLLYARLTGRVASGRVALLVIVHFARKRDASLRGLRDELLALKTGIGAQFVLDVAGNLIVRRSLGATKRHGQNSKQCNRAEV